MFYSKSVELELKKLTQTPLKASPPSTATTEAGAATVNGQIMYPTPSSAELLESQSQLLSQSSAGAVDSVSSSDPIGYHSIGKMSNRGWFQLPKSLADKVQRYSVVLMVGVLLPLFLILFVLSIMPRPSEDDFSSSLSYRINRKMGSGNRFAVIFDAESSRSRVHVFRFYKNMGLVHIGKDLELLEQNWPRDASMSSVYPQQGYQALPETSWVSTPEMQQQQQAPGGYQASAPSQYSQQPQNPNYDQQYPAGPAYPTVDGSAASNGAGSSPAVESNTAAKP